MGHALASQHVHPMNPHPGGDPTLGDHFWTAQEDGSTRCACGKQYWPTHEAAGVCRAVWPAKGEPKRTCSKPSHKNGAHEYTSEDGGVVFWAGADGLSIEDEIRRLKVRLMIAQEVSEDILRNHPVIEALRTIRDGQSGYFDLESETIDTGNHYGGADQNAAWATLKEYVTETWCDDEVHRLVPPDRTDCYCGEVVQRLRENGRLG